jgi:hypothetical protein
MVGVAVFALPCWGATMWFRSAEYRQLPEGYGGYAPGLLWCSDKEELVRARRAETAWNHAMAQKYDFAARYPWLSLEPDPPEPE